MLIISLILAFLAASMMSFSLLFQLEWEKPISRLGRYINESSYPYHDSELSYDYRKKKRISFRQTYEDKIEEMERQKGLLVKIREIIAVNLDNAEIPLTVEEFVLIAAGVSVALGAASFILTFSILVSLIFLVATPAAFYLYVIHKERAALHQFEGQIADAMDMMAGTLRAGYSFMQAMETISREMPNPIAKEFAKTIKEVSLGMPQESALKDMVKRVRSEDLDLFVTAIIINRQIGGNLAEIMDNISHTLRERYKVKGEIKVLTAQVRMSEKVIMILPFALVLAMFVINPKHIMTLIDEPIGRIMIVMALAGQMAGYFIVKKITDIKY